MTPRARASAPCSTRGRNPWPSSAAHSLLATAS
jgi:hypothetical protein